MWVYNPVISSSIFIHRRVLDQHGLFFDTQWRALGDKMWTIGMVRQRLRMAVLRRYTSTFADTGENLCLKPEALREQQLVMQMAPMWVRGCSGLLFQLHRVRALWHGLYFEKPLSYSVFTLTSPDRRVVFNVAKPSGIWKRG